MINNRSPVPLYYQLQEIIRHRIESGQWRPGDRIPREDEICNEFGLSKGTVRQALTSLVTEGVLNRRRGLGCFVANPRIDQNILSISGFTAYAKQTLGLELSSRPIAVNIVKASRALAEKLEVIEGTDLIEICKVRYSKNENFFMSTTYIPRARCPGLELEDHSGSESLFKLVQAKYGFQFSKIKCWFQPVLINEYEASLLNIEKGSPALMFERIRYTTGGRPLMVSKHIIRGDVCRFSFEINEHNP